MFSSINFNIDIHTILNEAGKPISVVDLILSLRTGKPFAGTTKEWKFSTHPHRFAVRLASMGLVLRYSMRDVRSTVYVYTGDFDVYVSPSGRRYAVSP